MSENTEITEEKQNKPHLFQKGQSGNPNGRPKGSVSVVSAIKKKLEECPEGKEKTYLHYLVEKMMKKAVIDEDVAMIKDIIDRVDGKPKQPLVGGEEGDNPIEILWKSSSTISPASGQQNSTTQPSDGTSSSPTEEPESPLPQ